MTARILSRLLALVLLVALATAFVTPARATSTWYVAPTPAGSNTSGGSCAAPGYNTISDAVTNAYSGDTIYVCAGTYDEVVAVSKSLTLIGLDAIIKPDSSTAPLDDGRRVAVYVTAPGVTVQGFEIDGTAAIVHYGIYFFNVGGTVTKNLIHDITNEIGAPGYDSAGVGILFFGWGQGIDGAMIDRNTVYNTGRMGIFIGGMQSSYPYNWLPSNNDLISRNNVYNTWQGPTGDGGGAVQINAPKDCTIEENVVHHTKLGWFYAGIYTFAPDQGNLIKRNNVHHNYIGIATWGSSTPPALEGNNLHQNTYETFGF